MTSLTIYSLGWGLSVAWLLSAIGILGLLLLFRPRQMSPEQARQTWNPYSLAMSNDSAKRAGMKTTSSPTSGAGVEYDAETDLVEALDILYRCHEYLDHHDLNPDLRREIAEFVGLDQHK